MSGVSPTKKKLIHFFFGRGQPIEGENSPVLKSNMEHEFMEYLEWRTFTTLKIISFSEAMLVFWGGYIQFYIYIYSYMFSPSW